MAIDQGRLMQSVYDTIFDALTTTPAGVGDGRPIARRETSYLTMSLPGIPVDVAQFANAWSPNNPEGSVQAAENFAEFVDLVPDLSPQYSNTGQSIDSLYGEVVRADVSPPPPDPAAQQAFQRAFDILNSDGTDYDDQGRPVTVKVDSPIYRNYKNKKAAYSAALLSYLTNYIQLDLSRPADARRWSVLAPALQAPLDVAFQDLQAARPGVVEGALATMGQHEASSLAGIFTNARQVYELTRRGSVAQPGLFWHACEAFPGNWFADSATANFTQMTVESRNLRINESSRASSWSAGGGVNLGLWRVGGGASGQSQRYSLSTETNEIKISFKLGRVEIRRRWLNPSLFSLRGWYAAGRAAGSYSSGQAAGNSGIFPLLPTAFIVARDIQISGRWGTTDLQYASQSISTRASVGWGPFSLSGSYSNSSSTRTYNSTFDGTTIGAPGIQVIAWVCDILPFSPPMGGPSGQPERRSEPKKLERRNPYHELAALSSSDGEFTEALTKGSPQPAPMGDTPTASRMNASPARPPEEPATVGRFLPAEDD